TATTGQLAAVEADDRAELRARVAGSVKAVHATIGSLVKQGDVLVEIDAPDLAQTVREKAGLVDQRKAERLLAETNLKLADERLKLFSRNAAAIADQMIRDVIAKVETGKIDVLLKSAQVEVAQADLERAKSLLDAATLRAPFDGVVIRRAVDPGS